MAAATPARCGNWHVHDRRPQVLHRLVVPGLAGDDLCAETISVTTVWEAGVRISFVSGSWRRCAIASVLSRPWSIRVGLLPQGVKLAMAPGHRLSERHLSNTKHKFGPEYVCCCCSVG